jgi:hypothetical protein
MEPDEVERKDGVAEAWKLLFAGKSMKEVCKQTGLEYRHVRQIKGKMDADIAASSKYPRWANENGTWHTFNLREDVAIELVLPSDLTDFEAARLSKWLSTLPLKS